MIGQRRVASLQIGAIKHSKTSLMGHQGAMESSLCSPSCYIIIYVHMLVYSILMWYNSPEDCSFYFFLCTLMLLLKVQNPAGSMLYAPFNPRKKEHPLWYNCLKKRWFNTPEQELLCGLLWLLWSETSHDVDIFNWPSIRWHKNFISGTFLEKYQQQ